MDTQSVPPTRPILGIDRRSGAFIALVPSQSQPGKWHVTTESSCDCKGFSYRSFCRHLSLPRSQPIRLPLLARLQA